MWRHAMETPFLLLHIRHGNQPFAIGFSSQRVSNVEHWCPILLLAWTSYWSDCRIIGGFRRHHAHVTSLQLMWHGGYVSGNSWDESFYFSSHWNGFIHAVTYTIHCAVSPEYSWQVVHRLRQHLDLFLVLNLPLQPVRKPTETARCR